jgi:sortase A
MTPLRRAVRFVARVSFAMSLLSLGYAAYVVIDANAYQAIEHRRLERDRSEGAPAPAVLEGRAIGEIASQRIGLKAVIAEGESPSVLERAVGHLAETAFPGQPGNVVLAGHRDTFFRPLRRIRVGDAITLKMANGDFEYLVESIAVVPPGDVHIIQPTSQRTLTLITCFPFSYVGAAPDRLIVRARDITASPRRRPAAVVSRPTRGPNTR